MRSNIVFSDFIYFDVPASNAAHIIPGIFLLCIPLVSSSPNWCIAFMAFSYGFSGASSMGGFVNLQEIAPNYSTTVTSIVSSFTNWNGILVPLMVATFTQDNVIVFLLIYCDLCDFN